MKETMTVHKALSELKILDSRIRNEISGCRFVVPNKHSNSKIGGVSISEFVDEVRKSYQSVRTLINRRNAIKRSVTRSNAVTMVSINGKEYSVAEAIDMKAVGVSYLKELSSSIKGQFDQAKRSADRDNGDRLESRTDDYIKTMYQGADMKNLADEIKRVRDDFINAQTVEIIDPIGAAKEVSWMEKEIDTFMSEVDSALSVSNALTTIDVEYETM